MAATGALKAQDNLKVSGYIQVQNQWGQRDAALKVGSPNTDLNESFNRFGIRRGRMKFTYETGKFATAVFQLDMTDKGIGIKDAYVALKDPWKGFMTLKGGVFYRPFGYEISYSSSSRETPERATVFTTLMPDERDLGASLTFQKSILKLEAGLFAGNGIKAETDNKKDFIGHLSVAKKWGNTSLGGGISYYNGRVWQGSGNVYSMDGKVFAVDHNYANIGKYLKREYFGADVQLALPTKTKLHAEFLFGQQPGSALDSKSPSAATASSADIWMRDFMGGYVMAVQNVHEKVALVAKYDFYDPNTELSGDEIGVLGSGTGVADLAQQTVGFGALWDIDPSIRLTAYYEINKIEQSDNYSYPKKDINNPLATLPTFVNKLKSDVFTLRLQYKF